MKYVITENQKEKIESLINNFIDEELSGLYTEQYYDFITLRSHEFDEDVEEWGEIVLEYDKDDGKLYINQDVIDKLQSLFGLSDYNLHLRIKKWFEKEFGVDIKYTKS